VQTLLIYPHLVLFAYNLREQPEVGSSSQEKSWDDLRNELKIEPTADFNSQKFYPFSFEDIKGFYQRIPLGETNNLLVSCFTKDENTCPDMATFLHKSLKKIEVTGNIGRTWLIFGYNDSWADKEREKVAKETYKAFTNSPEEPNFIGGDYFLGGSLFEVWQQPKNWANSEENNDIILICICPNKSAMQKIADTYYDLRWLFYYRHKIIWAYRYSKIIRDLLEKEDLFPRASTISAIKVATPELSLAEADLQQIKVDLHKNLVTLSKHTAGLEGLALQLQTLKTNLKNYQNRLEKIKTTASNEVGMTKLKLWEDFANSDALRYQEQIEHDYASLTPGLRVRERYIDTIRGIVEVTQAERDRRLERNIIIIGFGIGAASAAASAVSPFVETVSQLPTKKKNQKGDEILLPANAWANFFLAFIISIAAGGFSAWLAWILWQKIWSKSTK